MERQMETTVYIYLEDCLKELKQHISKEIKNYVVEKPANVAQTASYLGIHEQTLYKWMRQGKIPSKLIHRMGSGHFFFLSEIRDYLKSQ